MFFLFLLAHLVADFVLQPFWLVLRKRRWDGLMIHGGIVLGCMLLLVVLDAAVLSLWPAMLVITLVHVASDWWKVNHGDRILSPAIVPFLLDQAIHITTIGVILRVSLPADEVWHIAGSAIVPVVLYAGAYVTAAFVAPIGVMIWLDPTFSHLALSGAARRRGFVLGVAVVSLVVLAGVLALPLVLLGLLVALRYPASSHPLDRPTGVVTNLCIAAALGAVLVVIPM